MMIENEGYSCRAEPQQEQKADDDLGGQGKTVQALNQDILPRNVNSIHIIKAKDSLKKSDLQFAKIQSRQSLFKKS
jgi:hypothetical protein